MTSVRMDVLKRRNISAIDWTMRGLASSSVLPLHPVEWVWLQRNASELPKGCKSISLRLRTCQEWVRMSATSIDMLCECCRFWGGGDHKGTSEELRSHSSIGYKITSARLKQATHWPRKSCAWRGCPKSGRNCRLAWSKTDCNLAGRTRPVERCPSGWRTPVLARRSFRANVAKFCSQSVAGTRRAIPVGTKTTNMSTIALGSGCDAPLDGTSQHQNQWRCRSRERGNMQMDSERMDLLLETGVVARPNELSCIECIKSVQECQGWQTHKAPSQCSQSVLKVLFIKISAELKSRQRVAHSMGYRHRALRTHSSI